MNNFDKNKLSKIQFFLELIAEENRLGILKYLTYSEKCVCEIWKKTNQPQNLISYHLKNLKDFGLISAKKDGLKVIYKLNKSKLNKNLQLLNKYLS